MESSENQSGALTLVLCILLYRNHFAAPALRKQEAVILKENVLHEALNVCIGID